MFTFTKVPTPIVDCITKLSIIDKPELYTEERIEDAWKDFFIYLNHNVNHYVLQKDSAFEGIKDYSIDLILLKRKIELLREETKNLIIPVYYQEESKYNLHYFLLHDKNLNSIVVTNYINISVR